MEAQDDRGTWHAIGVARGRALRQTLRLPSYDTTKRAFAQDCSTIAGEMFPPLLELVYGMIEGSGFVSEDLWTAYFARDPILLGGCTSFAVESEEETPTVVGRNYDWLCSDRAWCHAVTQIPKPGLATTGYTHTWTGRPDLLNAEGVLVTLASLHYRPPSRPGLSWNVLNELVGALATTTAEAVELLMSAPHLRPMSYLIADAAGDAQVIEATGSGVRARGPENGVLVATNWPAAVELEDGDAVGTLNDGRGGARSRYWRVKELIAERRPGFDLAHAREVLSEHDEPVCSGDHNGGIGLRHEGWATLWSLTHLCGSSTLWLAEGQPCRTRYRPLVRPHAVVSDAA